MEFSFNIPSTYQAKIAVIEKNAIIKAKYAYDDFLKSLILIVFLHVSAKTFGKVKITKKRK